MARVMICFRAILKFKTAGCILFFLFILVNLTITVLREVYLDHNLELTKNLNFHRLYQMKPDRDISLYKHKWHLNVSEKLRTISLAEFWYGKRTGNPLIDDYGKNDIRNAGELGRGVILTQAEKSQEKTVVDEYNVNTIVSDLIPLNRLVPDSRINGCEALKYNHSLPSVSIIIPFYNEWLSVLLRTVYSIINRSPRHLLKEIILVDDASTLDILKEELEDYIAENFPQGLVRLLRTPERLGLISARMRGSRIAAGDVLIFFDSHMEVNIDWLPPLLTEIVKDRKVVAMATLDYITAMTFEYQFNENYLTRYGWDWRLVFFETYFRDDQIGQQKTDTRRGATMVGAAFAVEKKYFFELGGYDEGMTVWGGENLEMSWRVWLCGGRLLHVPCSRIGHVPRAQPYSFPDGREQTEEFNYKRAISVWMGNYSRFIYNRFPDMKTKDMGDISSRLELKSKLKCKEFGWYLKNVWPELNVFDENATVWGMSGVIIISGAYMTRNNNPGDSTCYITNWKSTTYFYPTVRTAIYNNLYTRRPFPKIRRAEVANEAHPLCLDNNHHVFQYSVELYLSPCAKLLSRQGFSLTTDNLLRTSLQCVVVPDASEGADVKIEGCIIGARDKWSYNQDHSIVHQESNLCLEAIDEKPQLNKCQASSKSQKWTFKPIHLEII